MKDSGLVRVEGPTGLEAALRKFKKSTVHILAEWKRRSYALGPSARRRQKAERAAARLRKQLRRRAEARVPSMNDD